MSFVDKFCETVGNAIISPSQFVWWSGVCAVSAMMGRHISTHTFVRGPNDHLFGNLFVLLVGPPGSGKTKALTEARHLLRALDVRVGPEDITGEKLFDFLDVKKQKTEQGQLAPGTFCLFLDEFDSLIHSGMSAAAKRLLNYLYDCREDNFTRDTYAHGEQEIHDLCLTLEAGCTPAHLSKSFEPMEWQEGLPSRLLMVYGEKPEFRTDYSRGSMEQLRLEADEITRFIGMTNLVPWAPAALEEYKAWCQQNWLASPPHPLLAGYGARRHLHLAKLSFVLSVARLSPSIQSRDFSLALAKLTALEAELSSCLALAGGNATKDVEAFIRTWIAKRGLVGEWEVRRMLSNRINHNMVGPTIEELLASRVILQEGAKLAPQRVFKIGEK